VYRYRTMLAVTLALLMSLAFVWACENPTYAYIYDHQRFFPDDYLLVCYYGPDAPPDAGVAAAVKDLTGESGYTNVNLEYVAVDVTKMDQLAKDGPEALAWAEHEDAELPFYVVMVPVGMGRYFELQSGEVTAGDIGPLVNSPKRQELAKMLASGKQGVLIVLEGSDKKANAAAMKAISEATAEDIDDEDKEIDSGLVVVRRDDPNEKQFVHQLLRMDKGLADEKGPLVYPSFARGFVGRPFVGEGIAVGNIAAAIQFMNGPCTCQIKDQLYELGYFALIDFEWGQSYIADIRNGGEVPVIEDDPLPWLAEDDTQVQPPTLVDDAVTADPPEGIGQVVGGGLKRLGWVAGVILLLGTAAVFMRRKPL
jgi:hypothetical protein